MTPVPDPPPDDDLVSDEDLVAYLDGELPPDDERAVEAQLAADADARTRADELKRTYDLLDFLPKPEPSASFTSRTLTALTPLVPASASGSQFVPARPSRRWPEAIAWVIFAVAAVAGGGFAHRLVAPPAEKRADPATADDFKLMARLPLYAGVDDLDFLRALEKADLFEDEPLVAADRPTPPMTDDEREALLAQFRTFPPARRQQLRSLHQSLTDLTPPDREPLLRTLEGYAVWLGRLPPADRRRVLDASPADRLDAVQSAVARQWRETLPEAKRAAIRNAAGEERAELVAIYRGQERGRRDEWELAARRWKQFGDKGHTPWPFDERERERKNDLPPGCRLTREELLTLKSHREAATQEGYWLSYGAYLLRLSEQHPTLPRPKSGRPIAEPNQVPAGYAVPFPRVRPLVGKWPDFALEVGRANPRPDPKAPPLGPCRPDEFAEPVRKFVLETLPAADRKKLEPFEGKWPQYPQKLLELARGQNLSVPEAMLPGEPRRWQEMYQLSGKK
jgi:hypothetical protein